jgi:hypothetical protein
MALGLAPAIQPHPEVELIQQLPLPVLVSGYDQQQLIDFLYIDSVGLLIPPTKHCIIGSNLAHSPAPSQPCTNKD